MKPREQQNIITTVEPNPRRNVSLRLPDIANRTSRERVLEEKPQMAFRRSREELDEELESRCRSAVVEDVNEYLWNRPYNPPPPLPHPSPKA